MIKMLRVGQREVEGEMHGFEEGCSDKKMNFENIRLSCTKCNAVYCIGECRDERLNAILTRSAIATLPLSISFDVFFQFHRRGVKKYGYLKSNASLCIAYPLDSLVMFRFT